MNRNSLKSMITVGMTGIVAVFTIMISVYFVIHTNSYLSTSIEDSALKILAATKNNVETQYNSIQYHKEFALAQKKLELKNTLTVVFSMIEKMHAEYIHGRISLPAAQWWIINYCKKVRYSNGVGYFWINTTGRPYPRMVIHPTIPALDGKILDDPQFNCALGKKENLFKAFVDVCLRDGSGYVDYLWPKPSGDGLTKMQPKISYVKIFKPWQWVIGTGLYIDDIEKNVRNRIMAVIRDLNAIISRQRIGGSGYFLIFDSTNRILVHPSLAGTDGNKIINPETGKKLLDEFKKAVASGKNSLEYIWDKPESKGKFRFSKKAFLTYYKPLKWYIAATIYKDDYSDKTAGLINGIIIFSLLFLMAAIAASLFISSKIIIPISRLIDVIRKTDEEGIPTEQIPETGTIEIETLGTTINKMVNTIMKSRKDLKNHSAFLQNITDNSPDMIFGMTPEGVIKFINPAGERLLGLCQSKIIGRNWRHLKCFTGKDGRALRIFRQFRETGLNNHQIELITKSGETRYIILNILRINDENGLITEILGFGYDITEQKTAEQEKEELKTQLAHRNKMDSIGQLAGGVAHDFNNILAGIMGSAELLNSPKRKLDKKSSEFVNMIIESVERATALIAKLLAFGRKSKMVTQEIELHKIIDDVIAILQRTIDKRIRIIFDRQAETDWTHGDKYAIQNALINLGINAAHAMPEGGELKFSTFNLELGKDFCDTCVFDLLPGSYIEIDVRDEGTGISGENLEKIFDPFFTTKDPGKGTGLGLAAVYGTIQDHHGAITVYSEPGEGTVFHLLLPCIKNEEEKEALPLPKTDLIMGEGHILLVDDEEIIRIIGKQILERLGYTVDLAENGREAVEFFRQEHENIDLVITDMIMPGMNGSETFLKMKEVDVNCRVIIASGFTKNKNIDDLQKEGLCGFLQKPFRDYELSRIVAEVLGIEKADQ